MSSGRTLRVLVRRRVQYGEYIVLMKTNRFRIPLIIGLIMALLNGCSSKPPVDMGVKDGRLQPCPASPNCVSTMAEDSGHAVNPIEFTGSREEAVAVVREIVEKFGGDPIRQEQDGYLRAEFRSKIFGFVDDVEFYLPEDQDVIHIRSAARLGYYDFGVNRRRVEKFRALFQKREQKVSP